MIFETCFGTASTIEGQQRKRMISAWKSADSYWNRKVALSYLHSAAIATPKADLLGQQKSLDQ